MLLHSSSHGLETADSIRAPVVARLRDCLRDWLRGFGSDESAQDMIEYALLAAIIALGTVAAVRGLAVSIGAAFTKVQTTLSTSV